MCGNEPGFDPFGRDKWEKPSHWNGIDPYAYQAHMGYFDPIRPDDDPEPEKERCDCNCGGA